MCGICAYLGKNSGSDLVLEGIQMLRNRGYDSVGCCSFSNDNKSLCVTKYCNTPEKNSMDRLKETFDLHQDKTCLMAHCRWATTGKVSDQNSHPHQETINNGKLAVVHNGIISNYQDLKKILLSKNVEFNSETDTEVIINLIADYQRQNPNAPLMDAIKLTLADLEGTWALIIMDLDEPDTLYISRNGSPIVIGYDQEMCIVSSQIEAFSNYLKNYHVVPDGQIIQAKFNRSSQKIEFYRDSKLTTLSTNSIIHSTLHRTTPEPYPHWTLREIMEQPEAAFRALNNGGRIDGQLVKLGGLKDNQEDLIKIKHLTIIASGTSFHAGAIGQKIFQAWSGFETVRAIDASEFLLSDLTSSDAGILVLSQSGETRDVIAAMESIRKNRPDVNIISIINAVESMIAREADCGVYLNAGREVGVASTKSFTNQVVVLHLMAIWYAQIRNINGGICNRLIKSLHGIKDLIQATLILCAPVCDRVVDHIINLPKLTRQHLFILGRGKGFPAAQEGSLKIKEISYIHSEAYPGGSLKHGPLALIDEGTPVIILRVGDSEIITHMDIAAEEVKSRGATVISIGSSSKESIYDFQIEIAKDQHMESLLSVIPMQYIAYRLAVKLGNSVDSPKNLAKVVTVH